ncbi:glycosyltransferase [Agrococcus citreus]|uniref:Glycosyl transferase family 1 domain-containing protein n=1 Tax=Agrococcus citreus TaxID=84643 RepID=A0ABN1YSB9_9MICO
MADSNQAFTREEPARATRLLIIQLALPHYRQELLDVLAGRPEIVFATGDSQAQAGVTAAVRGDNVWRLPRNRFFLSKRLIWQSLPWRHVLGSSTVVVELNPRIISTWLTIAGRRIARRRTLAWGHVHPRAGRFASTASVRHAMRSMLDGMIVYTHGEAADYRRLHPSQQVFVAANALYRREEIHGSTSTGPRTDFIVIGRLVESKKPLLAIQAFRLFVQQNPSARLVLLGSGPLAGVVGLEAADLVADGRVCLAGDVTDVVGLRDAFSSAVAMFAPGYVGLNVTQSLGFGVPVVYPDSDPHAPEAELLDASNSWSFASNSAESAQIALDAAWQRRHDVDGRMSERAQLVKARYAIEDMAEGFIEAARARYE